MLKIFKSDIYIYIEFKTKYNLSQNMNWQLYKI